MQIWEIFVLAAALAMDAFAVSICKGTTLGRYRLSQSAVVGLWFGGFQALMPALGYLLGSLLGEYVSSFDHWIVMLILCAIGIKTLREAGAPDEPDEDAAASCLKPSAMCPLAIATSIDAFAAGIALALKGTALILPIIIIGCVTFALTGMGVWVGHRFGAKFGENAERAGGIVLILLGIKTLVDHLIS